MIEWSDDTPSTDLLLTNISIYWFTGCYPTSIWCYRDVSGGFALLLTTSSVCRECTTLFTASFTQQMLLFNREIAPLRIHAYMVCYTKVSNTSKPMGCGWADVNVPMGVSWFPKEVNPPRAWIESTGKVSWFRAHEKVSLYRGSSNHWRDLLEANEVGWSFCCPRGARNSLEGHYRFPCGEMVARYDSAKVLVYDSNWYGI